MTEYQRRYQGGLIDHHPTFREAINLEYDKISFELEDGRLILRNDGSWEYWDKDAIIALAHRELAQ